MKNCLPCFCRDIIAQMFSYVKSVPAFSANATKENHKDGIKIRATHIA